MAIEKLGSKLYSGTKVDRVSPSLGSVADGTNNGITLVTVEKIETTNGTYSSGSATNANRVGVSKTNDQIAEGTKISKIGAYYDATTNQPYNTKFVVYTDSGGSPSTLICKTASVNPTGTGWLDFDVDGGDHTITSSEAGYLWIGMISDENNYVAYQSGQTGGFKEDDESNLNVPTSFTVDHTHNQKFACRVTTDTPAYKLGTGAYSFDGSNDYVQLSTKFNYLHDGTGGSIAFWVKPRNLASIHTNGDLIFDSMATSGANGTGIQIRFKTDKGMRFNFTDASNNWNTNVNSTTTFADDTWYHVAMTFGSSTVKVYVNGILEDTETFSNPNTNASGGNFTIGRHATDPSSYGYFDGVLDDIGIYKRVLTATEISDLVNTTTPTITPSLTSSTNWTTTQTDSSSNPHAYLDTSSGKLKMVVGNQTTTLASAGYDIYGGLGDNYANQNNWTLRFKIDVTSISNDGSLNIALSDLINQKTSVSADRIGMLLYNDAGTWKMMTITSGTNAFYTDGSATSTFTATTTGISASNGQTLYVEIQRLTNTTGRVAVSDTGYDSMTEVSGFTIPSTVQNLRYISIQNSNHGGSASNTLTCDISDIKFWNNVAVENQGALVSSLTDKSGLKAYYSMDSTSLADATYSTDFSSSTGWTTSPDSDDIDIANNRIEFDTSTSGTVKQIYYDLGSGVTSTSAWVFRAKVDFTTVTASGGYGSQFFIGLTSSTSTSNTDFAGIRYRVQASPNNDAWFVTGVNAMPTDASETAIVAPAVKTYYLEMKRTSSSDITLTLYNNSDYTDAYQSTVTLTDGASLGDLRYIRVSIAGHSNASSDIVGSVDDVAFYNGVTQVDGCANDFSTTSDLEALSGVRTNSLFQQVDTDISYWWFNGTSWLRGLPASTYSDNFSSDNWVDQDSGKIGVSGGSLAFNSNPDGSNNASSLDLGSTLSDTKWTMRFEFKPTSKSISSGVNSHLFIGMSSSNSATNIDTAQEFLGGLFGGHATTNSAEGFASLYDDGSIKPQSASTPEDVAITWDTSATYYIEMKRSSATEFSIEIFSDSGYSTSIGKSSVTPSGVTGLQYVKVGNYITSNSDHITGTIDNLNIWDGII
tara:strand:+ start:2234 stop:5524 length:3291 start_codon:yes stop_codon:yes gene_type:complete